MLLEIRCPLSCKNLPATDAMKKLLYFDDQLKLKRSQAHYTQVQAQMAITSVRRAVFVVYTGAEVHSEILHIDEEFWKKAVAKAKSFFLAHVLNEIQTRETRQKIEHVKRMYLCAGGKSGAVVRCVCCHGAYHIQCVKLRRTPRRWECHNCVQ